MKTNRYVQVLLILVILLSSLNLQIYDIQAGKLLNTTYHNLAAGPLLQNWSDPNLITTNDDWSNVPSIEGFRGDGLTNSEDTDPQTILQGDNPGVLDVNANLLTPNYFSTGGVSEFDMYEDNIILSIALSGSGTADAPYIKIYINSSTCSNIKVKYNVKDLDGSSDNAFQQVALHYRTSGSGNFLNVPSAYIEDATSGPGLATKITPVDVTLPPDANDLSVLEIRIMTTNANGNDEWVGIDDIEITGTCVDPYAEPVVPDCPEKIITYEGVSISTPFSASDQDGKVVQAAILNSPIQGIQLENLEFPSDIGGTLTGDLMINNDTSGGEYNLQLQFTNDDPNPQTAICTIPISVIPNTCSLAITYEIGEIQGIGSSSPFDSRSGVTISGVVTATFFEGGINGFYIQDMDGDENELTSDGIFISSMEDSLEVGQPVQITGTVYENFGRTQMIDISQFELCGNPATPIAIPVEFPISDPSDFEKYENMLVTFPDELFINEHYNFDRYGEIQLSSQRHLSPTTLFWPGSSEYFQTKNTYLMDRIILDDGRLTQNPDPAFHPDGEIFTMENLYRGGDKLLNVTGILDYAFGEYRIQPTLAADYINTNPRPTEPEDVGGNIKVASFNVMNYFTTLESRGAKNEEEFTRQRNKIIAAIMKLDADIIGLMEIENNIEAIENLVDGLNTTIGNATYTYINTGIIGVDEIKVAIIYKPATIIPIGSFAILDTSVDPRFLDNKNRPALAQTFSDPINHKNFTVIVNHLKSRSSACDDVGDPDLVDGAGNCNLTRANAAKALVNWLAVDPTGSGSNNFLIIGDLNSYTLEDPIQAILAGADNQLATVDDYSDLINEFIGSSAYTYRFNGQVGYLDHALASNFLSKRATGTSIWHINTDEPDLIDYRLEFKQPAQGLLNNPDEFRSSDHDPVILGLDFSIDIPPIALSKFLDTGIEDEMLVITLDAFDEYNRDLTFRIVSFPTNGNLQLNGNVVTYSPDSDFFGEDTFKFVAYNGIEDSNQATITLDIQPINDIPIAQDDSYEIDQNQLFQKSSPGVLENDFDIELDNLISVLVDLSKNGTIEFNQDGSFSYNPDFNFSGIDKFSYKAFDGKGFSSLAFVTINVNKSDFTSDFKVFLPIIIR